MVSTMSVLQEQTIAIGAQQARILRGGKSGAPAALFLHGGIPGVTPFCSGAHIWGDALTLFTNHLEVVAPDLPGSGRTVSDAEPLTIDAMGRHVIALLAAASIETADVIGHDLGGLLGIWLALNHPARVRSLSIVASPMSSPTGDSLDDLLFATPPRPLWSRESQEWAFERVSYSHAHIDGPLLDACVAASEGEAHRQAVESMKTNFGKAFAPSVNRAKGQLWEACRNAGVPVPTQIVWASHDPATTREAGFVLFDVISAKQKATQMHVINRAGSLPFREQMVAFHHIVASFGEGVRLEKAQTAA
jgi:2-hydroxy-6-oxonona-2,4-dienedioate hydrolase